MTGVDLEAVRARAVRAYDFAQRQEAPPHAKLEHVPLSVREHFETDVPALLGIIAELRQLHEPELRMVEWFYDQTGKGEALYCRTCFNADPTEWHPPIGQAGIEPEGFVASYVLSPCPTLAALTAEPGHRPVTEGAPR